MKKNNNFSKHRTIRMTPDQLEKVRLLKAVYKVNFNDEVRKLIDTVLIDAIDKSLR